MVTPRGPRAESLAQVSRERARLARLQADAVELKSARVRASLIESEAVEREWSAILASVRAGMLAVPSRCAARSPHLTPHDIAEIDQEVRAVLGEIGK